MGETYFEYALSKNKKHTIKNVCKRYQLPIQLKRSMGEDWKNYENITNDSDLIYAISDSLRSWNIIKQCDFAGDSLDLYNRCLNSFGEIKRNWYSRKQLDYDRLFDVLVDICWLFASIRHSERENERYVKLLSNIDQICDSIKEYLEDQYEMAIQYHNESVFIGEGIAAKREHMIFPGLYEYQYEQSRKYIHSSDTVDGLIGLKEDNQYLCQKCLTVYYELTITCGLAYAVLRGLE